MLLRVSKKQQRAEIFKSTPLVSRSARYLLKHTQSHRHYILPSFVFWLIWHDRAIKAALEKGGQSNRTRPRLPEGKRARNRRGLSLIMKVDTTPNSIYRLASEKMKSLRLLFLFCGSLWHVNHNWWNLLNYSEKNGAHFTPSHILLSFLSSVNPLKKGKKVQPKMYFTHKKTLKLHFSGWFCVKTSVFSRKYQSFALIVSFHLCEITSWQEEKKGW